MFYVSQFIQPQCMVLVNFPETDIKKKREWVLDALGMNTNLTTSEEL